MNLVERIQDIDADLSQRAGDIANGVSDEEYQQYMLWKGRVVGAKKRLVQRLQRTKAWINQQREEAALARLERRGTAPALLADLYDVAEQLASGKELTVEGQQIMNDVQLYLEVN